MLVVFVPFVQARRDVLWSECVAMVAYGLTMISALMIIVERKAGEPCESS
jgi:hypothetical protein